MFHGDLVKDYDHFDGKWIYPLIDYFASMLTRLAVVADKEADEVGPNDSDDDDDDVMLNKYLNNAM